MATKKDKLTIKMLQHICSDAKIRGGTQTLAWIFSGAILIQYAYDRNTYLNVLDMRDSELLELKRHFNCIECFVAADIIDHELRHRVARYNEPVNFLPVLRSYTQHPETPHLRIRLLLRHSN